MCGVTFRDRVQNEEVRRRVGVDRSMSDKVDERVLSWFGHVARMSGERLTKIVYELKVGGSRGRGRPLKGWMKGMKECCGEKRNDS